MKVRSDEMLFDLVASLVALSCILVAYSAAKVTYARKKINKAAPNLHILTSSSWLYGNLGLFLKEHNLHDFQSKHRKYGQSFTGTVMDLPFVSTSDIDLAKKVAVDGGNLHDKRFAVGLLVDYTVKDGILMASGERWRRYRKEISQAIAPNRVKSENVGQDLHHIADRLISAIETKLEGKEEIEIEPINLMFRYIVDASLTVVYANANSIDYLGEDKMARSLELVGKRILSPFARFVLAFPQLNPIFFWIISRFGEFSKLHQLLKTLVDRQVKLHTEARRQFESQNPGKPFDVEQFKLEDGSLFRRGLVDNVIDSYIGGKLSWAELYDNLFTLFMAAHNTSSHGLGITLYMLAIHEDVQNKLRASIREEGLQSEYLSHCINETLRLFPPVPGGCSRTLREDVAYQDGTLPAETLVNVQAYVIHRREDLWGDDADAFRPERWENLDTKAMHPCKYLAFGAGRKICPGKELFFIEAKLILFSIISHYKLFKCQKTPLKPTLTTPAMFAIEINEPVFIGLARAD